VLISLNKGVFMYQREMNLVELTSKANTFLFGPRATGKSSLINTTLSKYQIIDLLQDSVYDGLSRRPESLIELIKDKNELVVIDEIQKLPKLMDEVHRLIEKYKIRFLLTGSSARKLRKQGGNMLGGRARESMLFPLTWKELGDDFSLSKYLNYGSLPIIYTSSEPIEDLKAYCKNYLQEEIKIEAAVRNYDRFVRFMEIMAISNGQELNYEGIASDSGVPARTIESHIEVLKDTLIAYELLSFTKTLKRKAITRSKFYFFDTGVANYFSQKFPLSENSADMGILFEHFIINEVRAYLSYKRKLDQMTYWRSRDCEVDLIIGNKVGIEIKYAHSFKKEHVKGLLALKEEKLIPQMYVVGRFNLEGTYHDIPYLNYDNFLSLLWNDQII
jgi:predicted AAA+ superfamily ATPase